MQYRREISPITAARPLEDQEETARGVLSERPDGRWAWKMDPAYIEQRIKQGPPKRPPLWPVLETLPCATQIVWGTDSDVLSEAGEAHGRSLAKGRAGQRPWRRTCADPRRAAGPRRP